VWSHWWNEGFAVSLKIVLFSFVFYSIVVLVSKKSGLLGFFDSKGLKRAVKMTPKPGFPG
jgi:hypothetical protein